MPLDADLAEALGRPDLPPAFERFRVVLAPGDRRPTRPAEWAGCLVLVERGAVEVDCDAGGTRSFAAGDLLAPGWLPIRALRNPGAVEASLVAVRRRGAGLHESLLRVTRAETLNPSEEAPQ
ncbi:MAG TPA: hypothetical protein VLA59_07375 [Patescibacteria group bacterium]|nr:hypothetical protein [Patescibacteria group bacterium]